MEIRLPETIHDLKHLTSSLEKVINLLAAEPDPSPLQFEIVRLHAQAIAATMRGDNQGSGDVVTAFNSMYING